MDEVLAANYEFIRNELIYGEDEVIISGYLECMIVHNDSWPLHFIEDVDVYNKNPNESFGTLSPTFVIVKPRTEECGKTDGCESGCWRIMGRDKLVRLEDTEEIIGFKKILKFCVKRRKPREYKRTWIMEEYRVTNKLNWKQDHVICKIRLMFEEEISFLLTKQFSYLPNPYSYSDQLFLPSYGILPHADEASYLRILIESYGNRWRHYVTNDVYRLHPLTLVDPEDQMFRSYGMCIFTNRTEECGITDECDGGCWRIMGRYKLIRSNNGELMGFKRIFKFCEKQQHRSCEGKDLMETWTIEEYRIVERVRQNKVLCVLKLIAHQ